MKQKLVTQSASFHSAHQNVCFDPVLNVVNEIPNEKQNQQLTIFYNGNVAVCDVTELQARVMILLARREMEEQAREWSPGLDPCSPLLQSPLHSPTSLCMRRSMQRFLQKRKSRVQAMP